MTALPRNLEEFETTNLGDLLEAADLHFASLLKRISTDAGDPNPSLVALTAALTLRQTRNGHVRLDLATIADALTADAADAAEVRDIEPTFSAGSLTHQWPTAADPAGWADALAASDLVTTSSELHEASPARQAPLVLHDNCVYLHQSFVDEGTVAQHLIERAGAAVASPPADTVSRLLDQLFGPADGPDRQRDAVHVALRHGLTVIAGGPGTGKTYTVARLLLALRKLYPDGQRVAMAAPTGKAAARMTEALRSALADQPSDPDSSPDSRPDSGGGLEAQTLYRLLGARFGEFTFNAANPIPYDVVIIDETSMVSLADMARLLTALEPTARLVLVGDPFQLASIDAGSAMLDLVGPLASDGEATGPLRNNVVVLDRVHRFDDTSRIAELADAIRTGATDDAVALLQSGDADVALVDPGDRSAELELVGRANGRADSLVRAAAERRLADATTELEHFKVLAATNQGDRSVEWWRQTIEGHLRNSDAAGRPDPSRRWYPGRPILITENDPGSSLVNGDTGVIVANDNPDQPPTALFGANHRELATSRLDALTTAWAMTIHKSQGSEFEHVVVSLPKPTSRMLTRELLYTAVTRARNTVTLHAPVESVRNAVNTPVRRSSGLWARLWHRGQGDDPATAGPAAPRVAEVSQPTLFDEG